MGDGPGGKLGMGSERGDGQLGVLVCVREKWSEGVGVSGIRLWCGGVGGAGLRKLGREGEPGAGCGFCTRGCPQVEGGSGWDKAVKLTDRG